MAASAPESMGTVVGKLGVVWVGLFAGMKLGDWVLLATLVYTVLQILLLTVERIIKPILLARRSVVITSTVTQTDIQEK